MADIQEMRTLANERMALVKVCRLIGMEVYEGTNAKAYCPFGEFNHSDGGHSRAFRLYDASNTAWCFACSQYFTPVILYSMYKGIPEEEAVEALLELSGYVAPDPETRWAAVMATPWSFDRDSEAEALKMYCRRLDKNWSERQFDETISEALSKALRPLAKVTTKEELVRWRTITRAFMERALTPQGALTT